MKRSGRRYGQATYYGQISEPTTYDCTIVVPDAYEYLVYNIENEEDYGGQANYYDYGNGVLATVKFHDDEAHANDTAYLNVFDTDGQLLFRKDKKDGGSTGNAKLNENVDYEHSGYISICLAEDSGEGPAFWFTIDDSDVVTDGCPTGWIVEFQADEYKGKTYLDAFQIIYEKFDGAKYPHINFGFANMSSEREDACRAACEAFIHSIRPELPFEGFTDDFDHAYQFFPKYAENLEKDKSEETSISEETPPPPPPPPETETEPTTEETQEVCDVSTEAELIENLYSARTVVLQNDLNIDLSSLDVSQLNANEIDCNGHALVMSGELTLDSEIREIIINNASQVDISALTVNADQVKPIDEKLEENQMKMESIFVIHANYKDVTWGNIVPRDRIDFHMSRLENYTYLDINDEGTEVRVVVRIAQTYDARHEQEMEWLTDYLQHPEDIDGGHRMILDTDIELTLDDYNTPSDLQVVFCVSQTGSLKLSGQVNICGPRMIIESQKKGSVDLRELTVIRKCMSPDCISISCEEGIDEEKLQVNTNGAKVVGTPTEKNYDITIWDK